MVEIGKKWKESLEFLKEIQSVGGSLCATTPPISLLRMNPRVLWDVFDPCDLSVFGSRVLTESNSPPAVTSPQAVKL
jgi:hypothetical protein